ncbi:MAG: TetR family transcriptional regulator [Anaerolineales bacterium]|nr:TetR family transcriptional regulator [Anaerolineales bacterium]
MERKRAVTDSQKEQRRQTMLDAAEKRFTEAAYEVISMDEIAQQAKVAKGTLYLYFKTKEALFLALYTRVLEQWFDEIDARLGKLAVAQDACTTAEFTTLVGETLSHYPILTRLMSITHSILERNIDATAALAFKQMLSMRLLHTGQLTETCLPFLKPGQGPHLFLQLYALVIGIQSMAEPAPVVRPLLERPDLQIFQIDFSKELLSALTLLLLGIESQARNQYN